jgi:hypothetical protein
LDNLFLRRDTSTRRLRRQKAEGRRQEAEGIPINKFRGFNKDVFFLALRVSEKIFLFFFINKFRGFKPFWQRAKIVFSSFCLLPPALCLSSVKYKV